MTDGGSVPDYDPAERPGLANLLDILAALHRRRPGGGWPTDYSSYGALKEAVAEAVIETLRPVRTARWPCSADPAELDRVRKAGATRAAERGEHRLQSALRLIGAG